MSSQIFGNLVGGLIITHTSGPIFFLIMGIITLVSGLLFLCLKKVNTNETNDSENSFESINN